MGRHRKEVRTPARRVSGLLCGPRLQAVVMGKADEIRGPDDEVEISGRSKALELVAQQL